mgnify:CR=1 FL=1
MTALHRNQATRPQPASGAKPPFPFTAIVGQETMKQALVLTAIDPGIGGVLVFGDRGTGKSTAVRALAALLPKRAVVAGCAYKCAPQALAGLCAQCAPGKGAKAALKTRQEPTPVVDLPLGATEDRVVGALDIERALSAGEKAFEPGLLARAHGGFLYIDEVNLLEDHLVDLLLDAQRFGVSGQRVAVLFEQTTVGLVQRLHGGTRLGEWVCLYIKRSRRL